VRPTGKAELVHAPGVVSHTLRARLDEQGHLVLPRELIDRFGFVDGATVRVEERADSIVFGRTSANLARVYLEPTTVCNLHCRTCIRNVWDEPPGMMSRRTFGRIMDDVRRLSPLPTLFFGGFGEPFAHPDLLAMLDTAKMVGCPVELITNGTRLDDDTRHELVRIGLDRLWVSIDGASPESYADIRLWDALPQVTQNLTRLRELRMAHGSRLPRLGIAFVAMKRNIDDLPEVIRLGRRLGADRFSVSNVLPHTPEMRDQVLYARSVDAEELEPSEWNPEISLPRMDLDELTIERLARVAAGRRGRSLLGWTGGAGANRCPFVEKGSASVRWDGAISPCLPLLHTHRSYLDFRPRTSHAFSLGNINERSLTEAWSDPAYVGLRERLLAFDFAPCTICNSCDMADENLEDCFGSPTPACGGCLWAQGFIQCP
jgi:MoaA/NifB/PqqE/SkfB family radical SAM enzyme